jgi:glycosyltransferase involved in cell wall biosynthesis
MSVGPDAARPLEVLIVSDGKGPSATQRISFDQPFAGSDGEREARIVFEPHREDTVEIEAAFEHARPDVLILSRYTSPRGLDWIVLARAAHVPIIYHIDDDLLAVPESLGPAKFKAYNSPARIKALRDNIEQSDLFYVSTAELKARFAEHGIATPTVAGDLYCSVAPADIGALLAPATRPVIGYMGTGGHSADLAMILPAVCEVMDLLPSLNFELFGTIKMPGELARFGRRVRHLAPVADYADFIPHLRSLGWWVGLAPLEDNAFNRCKADTKWVEYSLAGMAVVASHLTVYQRACANGAGLLCRSTGDWRDAIWSLIHRPDLRQRTIAAAQARLVSDYSHDRLRGQVLDVIGQAQALSRESPRP